MDRVIIQQLQTLQDPAGSLCSHACSVLFGSVCLFYVFTVHYLLLKYWSFVHTYFIHVSLLNSSNLHCNIPCMSWYGLYQHWDYSKFNVQLSCLLNLGIRELTNKNTHAFKRTHVCSLEHMCVLSQKCVPKCVLLPGWHLVWLRLQTE